MNDAVQILDVTDPDSITAAGSIAGGITTILDNLNAITIFESGGHTYAAVSSLNGVQIMRIDAAPDTTPPVIALRGTNPATVIVNSTYTEPGAVCTDDGYGSTTLTSSGTVNASNMGSYLVTYSCTDVVGNAAMLSRAVIVKAAPPPAVLTLNATDSITDNSTLALGGAADIATFESGNHTYAAVAAYDSHGVQIINITNPLNITAAGSITGGITTILGNSSVITIFESDGHTYAAVAAIFGAAVQILNITNPSIITAADSITDDSRLVFNGPQGIATFESGGRTYAAVTGNRDDGVQILDVTDPYDITAAGSITDGGSDVLELGGPRGITTFESAGRTYAAVTGNRDDSVQILDVTDPYDITAADSITDGGSLELFGTRGITTFESGGRTYAAVTGDLDDGVQILDVTDPYDITATDSITEGGSLVLLGTADIATFKSGGRTYAAVAAFSGDGVQILDVTYPYNITAAGSIIDGDERHP